MHSGAVSSWEYFEMAILLVLVSVSLFTFLHFAEPGMHPLERTMSEYALTPWGKWMFPAAVTAMGASAMLIARRLWEQPGAWMLCLFGFAMIISGLFPADSMDPRAGEFQMTRSGMIHAAAGSAAIIGICIAARKLMPGAMGWLPLAGTLVFVIAIAGRSMVHELTAHVSLHGLGERIGFSAYAVWLVLASRQ